MSDDTQETMTVDAAIAWAGRLGNPSLPVVALAAEVRRLREELARAEASRDVFEATCNQRRENEERLEPEVRRLQEENAKLLADRDMHARHAAGAARELAAARGLGASYCDKIEELEAELLVLRTSPARSANRE